MMHAGSKGKPTNLSNMICCIGQQNVQGSRMNPSFNDRILPHYSNNELNNVTQKNDMVITIGAGTIWRYGQKYFEYLLNKEKAA